MVGTSDFLSFVFFAKSRSDKITQRVCTKYTGKELFSDQKYNFMQNLLLKKSLFFTEKASFSFYYGFICYL